MNKEVLLECYKKVLSLGVQEDISSGDITTEAIFDNNELIEATLFAKSDGILCGIDFLVYTLNLDNNVADMKIIVEDGQEVRQGQEVMSITIPQKTFLKYERIALNVVQHLSGIATKTRDYTEVLKGTNITLLDTRKTLPGWRLLQKYAILMGGGKNHRMGLYDMFLIKDNHIHASGGVEQAVKKVVSYREKLEDKKVKIEIECSNLDEVRQSVELPVDIIMLDNMSMKEMRDSLSIIPKHIATEISGNVNRERLKELRELSVNFISVGSLTHSVEALDFSMKIVN